MSIQLKYKKQDRTLDIRGVITKSNGTQISLTADDVVRYQITSSIGTGWVLGATDASSYTLEISNVGRNYNPSDFDGAEVHMYLAIANDAGVFPTYLSQYDHFGVWYVVSSSASEQSTNIVLAGHDALAVLFDRKFNDTNTYPLTIGTLYRQCAVAAGLSVVRTSFPQSNVSIPRRPDWEEDVTLRDILQYCAVCAGGFVRVARDGRLDIRCFHDFNMDTDHTAVLDADWYTSLTAVGGMSFRFNAIQAQLSKDSEAHTRFANASGTVDSPTNCIQVEWFPLITEGIMNEVLDDLRHSYRMDGTTLTWIGDPAVQIGDYIVINDTNDGEHQMMVLSQTIEFDGGMRSTEQCSLPSTTDNASPSYSTAGSVLTANGNVKAARIEGLDKRVIDATDGYIGNLTSETIRTDTLIAKIIQAINLTADEATITKLNAGTIEAGSIKADRLDTQTMNAAYAHINNGVIDNATMDAASVNNLTVRVQEEVGRANIDFAKIKILDAETGIADDLIVRDTINAQNVIMRRLALESGQIDTAVISNLVLKVGDGDDAQYVRLSYNDATGTVTPIVLTVGEDITVDEIAKWHTEDGTFIEQFTGDTSDLAGTGYAEVKKVLQKVKADSIDVDHLTASEAFIGNLSLLTLQGAHGTLGVIAGNAEQLQKYFTYDENGLRVNSYTTDEGGEQVKSKWSTLTDNVGYHIDNTEVAGHVASFAKDRLTVPSIDLKGSVIMKRSGNGGMKWVVSEEV